MKIFPIADCGYSAFLKSNRHACLKLVDKHTVHLWLVKSSGQGEFEVLEQVRQDNEDLSGCQAEQVIRSC